jgi:hypothetical protein
MTRFAYRMFGAAALDPMAYEDVESDKTATVQALGVVVLSSAGMAAGFHGADWGAFPQVLTMGILGWASWALLTFEIGSRLLPQPATRVDVGELLRTLGFSTAPGVLGALSILPGLTVPATLVAGVWMLLSMVVAVRQALDYDRTSRAIAVCAVGWLLTAAVWVVFSAAWTAVVI